MLIPLCFSVTRKKKKKKETSCGRVIKNVTGNAIEIRYGGRQFPIGGIFRSTNVRKIGNFLVLEKKLLENGGGRKKSRMGNFVEKKNDSTRLNLH